MSMIALKHFAAFRKVLQNKLSTCRKLKNKPELSLSLQNCKSKSRRDKVFMGPSTNKHPLAKVGAKTNSPRKEVSVRKQKSLVELAGNDSAN